MFLLFTLYCGGTFQSPYGDALIARRKSLVIDVRANDGYLRANINIIYHNFLRGKGSVPFAHYMKILPKLINNGPNIRSLLSYLLLNTVIVAQYIRTCLLYGGLRRIRVHLWVFSNLYVFLRILLLLIHMFRPTMKPFRNEQTYSRLFNGFIASPHIQFIRSTECRVVH